MSDSNGGSSSVRQTGSTTIKGRGGASPFVVSYRKITKRPVYERVRNFVGFRRLFLNAVVKALDFVEDICFESENKVLDPGEQTVVHWAIEVDDPWGVNPQADLTARRVPDKPGCGGHFEVIRIIDEKAEREEALRQAQPEEDRPVIAPALLAKHRPAQDAIRARMRERLIKDGHYDPEAGAPPKDD